MPFSIKIIDLGATSGNPLTTFTTAELNQIQLAATDWAALLSNNDFADLSGATVIVTNGQGGTVPVTLGNDDITIFVSKGGVVLGNPAAIAGAFPSISPIPNQSGFDYAYFNAGTKGIKYQPPAGSITFTSNPTFSTTPPSIGSPDYYLYAVAKHEIAHILGFTNLARTFPAFPTDAGNSGSTFNQRVVGNNFVGPNTGTVALNPAIDTSHFAKGTQSTLVSNPNKTVDALMVPEYSPGPISIDVTKLDLAVLADLGYTFGNPNIYGFTDLDLANPIATNPNITTGFRLAGTPAADTLTGNVGDDSLAGGPGDDSINGGLGGDSMYGGLGNDTFYVDSALDKVFDLPSGGADKISIQATLGNNSIFNAFLPKDPNIEIVEDLTNQLIAFGSSADNIPAIALGGSGGWEIYGGEGSDTLIGDIGNDTLLGEIGDDSIDGGLGDDSINGGAGRNTLSGGVGNDTLIGGNGFGTLYGDDGDDVLTILAIGDAKGTLFGGIGNDTLNGGNKFDSLNGGADNDSIFGGGSGDVINGDDGNDTLRGDDGNDSIRGGNNRDSLFGGSGNDSMFGDGGNDALFGGAGNDTLFGGTGTNNLQGFDINVPSATEVDTLFHSSGSLNRLFLAAPDINGVWVNGYKNGGDSDYALIKNYLSGGQDVLAVANTFTITRSLVGGNIWVRDGSELIAIVEGITNPVSVIITTAAGIVPLP